MKATSSLQLNRPPGGVLSAWDEYGGQMNDRFPATNEALPPVWPPNNQAAVKQLIVDGISEVHDDIIDFKATDAAADPIYGAINACRAAKQLSDAAFASGQACKS
jgi:hypothetical protein